MNPVTKPGGKKFLEMHAKEKRAIEDGRFYLNAFVMYCNGHYSDMCECAMEVVESRKNIDKLYEEANAEGKKKKGVETGDVLPEPTGD
mgnify:FL=1